MKAVLFDYNGTLYSDDDINNEAWIATVNEISGGKINAEEFYIDYIGVRNYPFVEAVFKELGLPLDPEKIMYWAKAKETKYYQNICREKGRDSLKPGAAELLDHLKEKKIPINLCTASLIENVDFYFDYLKLDRWFDKEKVVYDSGEFADKKEMYLEGAARLQTDIRDCLIFDDSPASIRHAVAAGCENLVVIRKPDNPDLSQIKQKINDFTEFDYGLLDS